MNRNRLVGALFLVTLVAPGLAACEGEKQQAASPQSEMTAAESPNAAAPQGDYVLVALRRSGRVESTLDADTGAFTLGDRVSFGQKLDWLGGVSCDRWTAEPLDEPVVILDDPNLSDVAMPPLDMDSDPMHLGRSIRLTCEGAPLADLREIDARVFVVHGPTGALNAVLQKPLDAEQVRRLQAKLKDMKFYSGEITGEMDADTRSAVAIYAEYRGARFTFADPVITVNLLDRLGVLEE